MKNLKVEISLGLREAQDFQDEADPTEMKKEDLQDFQDCAQREKVKMKNEECRMKNEECRMKN